LEEDVLPYKAGSWLLAAGSCWPLEAGRWKLACWPLAAGRWPLIFAGQPRPNSV